MNVTNIFYVEYLTQSSSVIYYYEKLVLLGETICLRREGVNFKLAVGTRRGCLNQVRTLSPC